MLCLAFAYGNWYDLSRVTLTRRFTTPRSCNVNKFFLFIRVTRVVCDIETIKCAIIYIRVKCVNISVWLLRICVPSNSVCLRVIVFRSILIVKYSSYYYTSNFFVCIFWLLDIIARSHWEIKYWWKICTIRALFITAFLRKYLLDKICSWIFFTFAYVKTHCEKFAQ